MEYELVIVWWDSTTDVYEYSTYEAAEESGKNMKIALGDQIEWWGVRKAIFQ